MHCPLMVAFIKINLQRDGRSFAVHFCCSFIVRCSHVVLDQGDVMSVLVHLMHFQQHGVLVYVVLDHVVVHLDSNTGV